MSNKEIVVHVRIMESQDFISRLKKLIEEAKEAEQAKTQDELTEELVDVLEVIHTLAQENDISIEEIEKFRLTKREFKGGFDSRIHNSFIDLQEDSPAIDYYLSKANPYPEIHHPQTSCIFCQIANHERETEIIASFKHCFVIKDQFPV
jgi:predicted house-cleaning noncanonical NTP pyrophosphatase (MazG superfamily)